LSSFIDFLFSFVCLFLGSRCRIGSACRFHVPYTACTRGHYFSPGACISTRILGKKNNACMDDMQSISLRHKLQWLAELCLATPVRPVQTNRIGLRGSGPGGCMFIRLRSPSRNQ
jgi:hypothetical protein